MMVFLGAVPAVAQIKIVAYNCHHDPDSTSNSYWNEQLANYGSTAWYDSYYGAGNYGTIPQRPTIMALTECNTSLQGETDSVSKIVAMLNNIYGSQGANYVSTQIHAGSYEDYAYVYDSTQVDLLDTMSVGIGYRPAYRAHFRPVGYTSTNSDFFLYNCHLKAYPDYEEERLGEVNAMLFRASGAADELPADANIIYLGDFNFTTSGSEPGYDLLLNPSPGRTNPGVAFDPLADVCNPPYGGSAPSTYSTYSATGPWSRIDFQFPSTELGDGEGMDYIDSVNGLDSCHAHGNNNGSTSGYQAAQFASDHLAVIADYQLPAKMTVNTNATSMVPVIVGADVSLNVTVENSAPVIVAAGADELDYSISGIGVVTGSANGVDMALGGGNLHAISLNTSVAGDQSGFVQVYSPSPAVENGNYSETVNLTVLDHSEGSFASGSGVHSLTLDLGNLAPSDGMASIGFNIYNLLATAVYTADLEIDSIEGSGDTTILTTDLAPTSITAGDSESFLAILDAASDQGLFSANYIIHVSDEDLLGATQGILTLQLNGYIAINGDINLDKRVDSDDLNLLLSHYGQLTGAEWGDGDINGNGAVNSDDLNLLLSNYGTNLGGYGLTAPTARSCVPEPTLWVSASLGLACIIILRWRSTL